MKINEKDSKKSTSKNTGKMKGQKKTSSLNRWEVPPDIGRISKEFPKVKIDSTSLEKLSNTYKYIKNINSKEIEKYLQHTNNLENEINHLKRETSKIYLDIVEGRATQEETIQELKEKNESLEKKEKLSFLLNRVSSRAGSKLMESDNFLNNFNSSTSNAYIISIDIRKSTDLMLKAKDPSLFAQFISCVADMLRDIVISNNGIFDKFTGDGVLAYFPEFYSGSDAGYFCAKVASEAHKGFEKLYKNHRHCFTTIRKDIGLGIGIDYGLIHLEEIGGEIIIVGTPIVYACRMASAKAGTTLINQPAYEKLFEKYSAYFDFEETTLEIKHEGEALAYKIVLNPKMYEPIEPNWE